LTGKHLNKQSGKWTSQEQSTTEAQRQERDCLIARANRRFARMIADQKGQALNFLLWGFNPRESALIRGKNP
jgi:hypothetical protein